MDNIHARRQTPMPILEKLAISPAYEERLKEAEDPVMPDGKPECVAHFRER